ncbi:MAG: ArnT family glycosyltransferase [Candidatus Hodarchaeota archaeon]
MITIISALGEVILNLILFILMFLAGLSIGNYILIKFMRGNIKIQGLDNFIFSAGLGLGILGYLTLGIGFLGLLYRPIGYLILVLLLAIGIYQNRNLKLNLQGSWKSIVSKFVSLKILEKWLFIFIVAISLLNLIAALAPATGQDSLVGYLEIPKIFFREHKIFHLKENFASNYPILPSVIYLFGLMLYSGIIGQLIHWTFSILSVITLYAMAKRFSKTVGLFSSAIFLCLQPVIWESSLALTDIATVFFLLLAFYAFVEWISSEKPRWIILTGITGGFAAGCKGFGPIYIGTLGLLIFINTLIRRGFKNALKIEVYFIVSFLAAAAVWYVKAYVMTGNPFFSAFFGGKDITVEWLRMFEREMRVCSPARTLKSLLLFPIDLTFFYHIYKSGWIGPLFLTYIPLILFRKEIKDKLVLNIFGYCLILFSFISFLRLNMYLRHYLIFFALLAIPTSIVIHRFINSAELKTLKLPTLVVVSIWLGFTFAYTAWKKLPNFPAVVGAENKDHYLQRMIPEDVNFMQTFKFIDKNLPQDAKILYVGSRGYYLNRDYIRFWRLSTGLLNTEEIKNSNEFFKMLKKLGITHILIDYEIAKKHATRFDIEEGYRLFGLLNELISEQKFSEIYQINSCFLYQI